MQEHIKREECRFKRCYVAASTHAVSGFQPPFDATLSPISKYDGDDSDHCNEDQQQYINQQSLALVCHCRTRCYSRQTCACKAAGSLCTSFCHPTRSACTNAKDHLKEGSCIKISSHIESPQKAWNRVA